jgi:SAM-dependent methyltransferase
VRSAAARILEPSELHEFWRQAEPEDNEPLAYTKPVDRSRVLSLILADVPRNARVLEVGCNVGRNLAYLADSGYTALEGLEINPHAVSLLRETYPQLDDTPIHLGAAEELLPELAGPYDLVYTMAVLEHIHPSSTVVFDEICRLADTILAIEPARGREFLSSRQYPHDFRRVFRQRGMELASFEPLCDERWQPNDLGAYAAWRFVRASAIRSA